MKYRTINNVIGWIMFAVSLTVYMLTLEPSVSLWDCGEFLAASDKLQVVHPPGAPFFLMMGRLFSLFASKADQVAMMVNTMSAICSALTVMFTYWITVHFAKKIVADKIEQPVTRAAVWISGIVGALALTFCDTFWFSAVEAEVYAMSSCFTAMTFWAALRWEESTSKYADKWLIMIGYLIGLAIGAHLLNLLVIPAVAFIYYYKNYNPTRKGLIYTFIIGMGVLFFIQKAIIPGIPALMAQMDLFFVNTLGFGFNVGTVFAIILCVAALAYGIYYFGKVKVMRNVQLAFICTAYIFLGYSSYAMVYIRSNDNPAIDMMNPEEPFNLLSYINREQYEERPLVYGPYFNAPYAGSEEGSEIYRKDKTQYTGIGKKPIYKWDPDYNVFFPRMSDKQKESSESGYRYWGGMDEIEARISNAEQTMRQSQNPKEREQANADLQEAKAEKPRMSNNLQFFFAYQLNYMYWRYLMWNFAGRQNDLQGHSFSRYTNGNWISGLGFIDNYRLGPQDGMPKYLEENKAKNKFYLIPLLLGVAGLILQFKKAKKDGVIMTVLFLFTGILIIVFLNQPPFEPRERDYVHVGSFQAFCTWIGLGVLWLWERLQKWIKSGMAALVVAGAVSFSAPILMGSQGWDDHDRSKRYLGVQFARDYLMSCPQNAILLCNGDNDTYPLWYVQNVEGYRRDVRIINQNLLPTDWYSQVLLTKVYQSDPLPLSLKKEQLSEGVNDYFQYGGTGGESKPKLLSQFVREITSSGGNTYSDRKLIVPVNREAVLASGTVAPEDSASIVDQIVIDFPGRGLHKGDLVLLDLIATNAATGWKRPIVFSATVGNDGFLGMEAYMERRGLVHQLVPIKTPGGGGDVTRINKPVLYDLLMNKYSFCGIKEKKNFYVDDKADIVTTHLQQYFVMLASDYFGEADYMTRMDSLGIDPKAKERVADYKKRAGLLLDKCIVEFPEPAVTTRSQIYLTMARIYQGIGQKDKAKIQLGKAYEQSKQEVAYFVRFNGRPQGNLYAMQLTNEAFEVLKQCASLSKEWGLKEEQPKMDKSVKEYEQQVTQFLSTSM